MKYCFDAANMGHRLVGAVDGSATACGSASDSYVKKVVYAPHGGIAKLELGNGLWETTLYNSRLQPTDMRLGTSEGGSQHWRLQNNYGAASNNGNVLSQTLTMPKTTEGTLILTQDYNSVTPYDNVNRLKRASESGEGTGWTQTYNYDRYGNLTQSGNGLPPGLGCTAYDTSNNRCQDVGHDGVGNVDSYGGRSLTYDAENHQKTLTDGGTTFNYYYDGEGRRVKKVTNLGTTIYVYDALGQLAVEYQDYTSPDPPDCTTCYLTGDHLGSTRVVTDENGEVTNRYDYFPFGGEIPADYGNRASVNGYSSGDWFNPKFTGKERDYESGLNLDYFGARYFGGAQGRFTTVDPLMASAKASNPQTWNRYAYALNNPLRFIDPDGLEVPEECANDPDCTIVVKVNVIYDQTVNGGKGLTGQQKEKFEQGQIERAQKDYGTSNIKLDVTYTAGSYTVGANGQPQVAGTKSDALNLIVSSGTPNGAAGVSGVDVGKDVALTFVNFNEVHDTNAYPLFTNTTEHEFGHQFLGHGYLPQPGTLDYFMREASLDSKVAGQAAGFSQQSFREGLVPRRYAAPLNPEANKPQQ